MDVGLAWTYGLRIHHAPGMQHAVVAEKSKIVACPSLTYISFCFVLTKVVKKAVTCLEFMQFMQSRLFSIDYNTFTAQLQANYLNFKANLWRNSPFDGLK